MSKKQSTLLATQRWFVKGFLSFGVVEGFVQIISNHLRM